MKHTVPDKTTKELISYLSHELRNPLATVLSSAELLCLQPHVSEDSKVLCKTITDSVRLMTQTLSEVLDATNEKTSMTLLQESDVSVVADDHARHSILVVDDNELAAAALGAMLQMRGHTIHTAFTGEDALAVARQVRPDVMIVDIGLPGMDGYELARLLQEEKDFSPILIALTGYGQADDKSKALGVGFRAHATKPIGLLEIEKLLQQVMHSVEKTLA